ncbi:MAG: YgaP family membrane protein [Acidiferrobacterales bacterium]
MQIRLRRNVGTLDRILRAGVSILMIYFGFFSHALIDGAVTRTLLGVFGVVHLAVVVTAFCPLYSLVDFNTAVPKFGIAD